MNDKLASLLAEVFNLKPDQITLALKKEEVGNWDSLKQMDLVMSLEQQYDIVFEIEDIVQLDSVENIVKVLKQKGVDFGD